MPTIVDFTFNNFRFSYHVFFDTIKAFTICPFKNLQFPLPSQLTPLQLCCNSATFGHFLNFQTRSNYLKITKIFITDFSLLPHLPMELVEVTAARGNKRPNPGATVDANIAEQTEAIAAAPNAEEPTTVYDQPPPPPPRRARLDVVPADSGTYAGYLARTAEFRNLREANRALARRDVVQQGLSGNFYARNTPGTASFTLVEKSNPIASDPLVQLEAARMVDFNAKIAELTPIMTDRQREIIRKMQVRATTYRGSKHGDLPKVPTTKQKEKILYRAIELFSQRRAAQLRAQARRAAKERHALQTHKRTVALADGSTVNYNKRAEKKQASDSIKKTAKIQAQIEAGTQRARMARQNKAERVAIATAHGRKINRKDLPRVEQ